MWMIIFYSVNLLYMDSTHIFWDVRNDENHVTVNVEITDFTVTTVTDGKGGGNVSPHCDVVLVIIPHHSSFLSVVGL